MNDFTPEVFKEFMEKVKNYSSAFGPDWKSGKYCFYKSDRVLTEEEEFKILKEFFKEKYDEQK